MNYVEWAEEYYADARRIEDVISKKKQRMNDESLTAERRQKLTEDICSYRQIRRELIDIADLLMRRARGAYREA